MVEHGADHRTPELVVEVFVRDLDRSLDFYCDLGFELESRTGGFAILHWQGRLWFLDERPDLPPHEGSERANVRVMVPDVDAMWRRVRALRVPVATPIADRHYGQRDFTVRDPDGFGIRFATRIEDLPGPTDPPSAA
ncbi:MAG: VOC family protein [Gemmatimonadota bacterium]|nr:VOC family protein [Gemmatimonadota bacterium]